MDRSQLAQIETKFVEELQLASKGNTTSLPFIKHQLPSIAPLQEGQVAEVIVIGGSIFKKALVKKHGSSIEILSKSIEQKVIFNKGSDLLSFVEEKLDENIDILAINFAYPLSPVFANGKLEGVLVSGSKENSFEGLENKNIAQELEAHILQTKNRHVRISIANDTICLLLSGLTKYTWNSLVGGVVGTGINFAFFLDQQTMVNLESSNFDKFQLSDEAKVIDQNSQQIGKALFEKETSGAYLYGHFNQLMKQKDPSFQSIRSSEELTLLAEKDDTSPQTLLARDVLHRSALLVSAQVAAIEQYKQQSLNFIMEGSLFWHGWEYKDTVESSTKQLETQFMPTFEKIEESAIFGGAKLIA